MDCYCNNYFKSTTIKNSDTPKVVNTTGLFTSAFLNVQRICIFNSLLAIAGNALMCNGMLTAKYELDRPGIVEAQWLRSIQQLLPKINSKNIAAKKRYKT